MCGLIHDHAEGCISKVQQQQQQQHHHHHQLEACMPPPAAPSAGHASWSPVVVDRTERPSSTDAAGGVVENQLGVAGHSGNSACSAEGRAAADGYEADVAMFAAERADGWHSVRRRGRKEKRPQQQKKEEEEMTPGNEAAMGSDKAKTEGDVVVKTNGGGREKMLVVGDCS